MKSEEKGIRGPEKQSVRARNRYSLPPEADIPGAAARIMRQGLSRVFLSLKPEGQLKMLRETDGGILPGIRKQVLVLLDSLEFYRRDPSSSRSVVPAENLICHKPDLESVMSEVLWNGSEESFCFLNEGKLREKMRFLKEHFHRGNEWRKIFYAVKANPKNRILQILLEEGVDGFDCASIREIDLALAQNVRSDVLFNNPVKPLDQMREAYQRGVRYFTAQSRGEIERILRVVGPRQPRPDATVAVRVTTPNEDAEIDLSDKYGASVEDAVGMLRALKERGGVSRGLAIHTGSQNKNPETFRKGIELMTRIARNEGGVASLNLGGGIPVNYHPRDHFETKEFLEAIDDSIQKNLKGALVPDGHVEPKIILELGRAIVAEAVDLAIPVLSSEVRNGERCLYVNDGVFTSFSDAVVHQWPYYFNVVRKEGGTSGNGLESYRLHGRTCDSGDTLGKVNLPAGLESGDYLWVKNAGAYLDSQTSYFNGFDPPTYVSYNL
jgi:ornithine decarboxylase